MLKKVDLLAPPRSLYHVMHHFTRKLNEAFNRQGIKSRIHGDKGPMDPRKFLDDIWHNPPDCTISFNGFLPDAEGRFLCDELKIPHVAILIDSPNHFYPLANSTHTIIASHDRDFAEFFKMMPVHNVLFCPHATEKDIEFDPEKKRDIDVGVFASYIDYEKERQGWKRYSKELSMVLENAAEITLSDQKTSYLQAFIQAAQEPISQGRIDPAKLNHQEIFNSLENYVRAKDRFDAINSIKDAKVHIFGGGGNKENWPKKIFTHHHNITMHHSVTFDEVIELMKRSKIILNNSAHIKNGAHERVFTGFASGAMVMSSENPYLDEHFTNHHDIVYYQHKKYDEINDMVNEYLGDEKKRLEVMNHGRKLTMEHHTWDNRVNMLKHLLPPILKKLPKREHHTS